MEQHAYKSMLVCHAKSILRSQVVAYFEQHSDLKIHGQNCETISRIKATAFWASEMHSFIFCFELNCVSLAWAWQKIRDNFPRVRNEDQLINQLREEWKTFYNNHIWDPVHSTPRRCKTIIESKGLYTKY